MHEKRRLRILAFLMSLSFLMLTGFTLRWLYVQFGEEKLALNNKLKTVFEQRMDFYFDEAFKSKYLLARKLNDSVISAGDSFLILNDSVDVAALAAHTIPGLREDAPLKSGHTKKNTILMRQEVSFSKDSASVNDHTNHKTEMRIDVLPGGIVSKSAFVSDSFSSPQEGILRSGFAAILSELEAGVLNLHMDTAAFKKDLQDTMKENYAGILYSLHGATPGDMIIVKTPKGNATFSFSVRNYQWFLFKGLLPQIGFCAAMLGLCSIAFLLSYFTVRQQAMLTEQKNDFISNISHELKTPVTTAQLALEAFSHFDMSADPQKTKDYLEIAVWEMKRLEMLVSNVLNNARLEEGRILFQKETVLLNELLSQLVQQLIPVCRELQKQLSFDNNKQPLFLSADKLHLQGAVYNIIDNAVKYGKRNIQVTLTDNTTHTLITVSDDGPGIPREYRAKIFDKFFRVPNGNEHLIKGHGLGLHYARYVIEQHGGTINVTDTDGSGTVFSVSLPKNIPGEN